MGKQSALRRTAAQRSPEREVLAQANAAYAELVDTLARTRAGCEQAQKAWSGCAAAVREAEAVLADARKNESSRLAAQALGEDAGPTVADAEAALARAKNDRAVARSTQDALEARIEREKGEIKTAHKAVDKAVAAVFAVDPTAVGLLRRARAMQEDLVSVRAVLRFLQHFGAFEGDTDQEVAFYLRNETQLPETVFFGLVNAAWDNDRQVASWRAWAEALRSDADAPSPQC